ncbi:MAG: NAD-dependent epimerase/dehydratase family protein [Pararhodobacter sp.]|nr:NAD-dependent epimerase/dehydratase family protein [Pararhodobacter sp.]
MAGQPTSAVLLVGASGRVGRLLLPAWRIAGQGGVIVQQRGEAPLPRQFPGVVWSPLEQPALLPELLADHLPVRAMIVLAGVTPSSPMSGAGADRMALNDALAQACLRAAHEAGIGRVLLASSSAVYGAGRARPWHESDALHPPSPYGRAKLVMEKAAPPWRARGVQVCSLRIGNVAGADALLSRARQDETLLIDRFSDGTGPERSYIGPQSLARVLMALTDPAIDLPACLNIGAPTPVTMDALADAAGLPWEWRPAPPQAVARLTLDCDALAALVPFDDSEGTATGIVAQWMTCRSQA